MILTSENTHNTILVPGKWTISCRRLDLEDIALTVDVTDKSNVDDRQSASGAATNDKA